jgi:hypothetical protein
MQKGHRLSLLPNDKLRTHAMLSPQMRRPLLAFGTAASVVVIAGSKQLDLSNLMFGPEWQCSQTWFASALRILAWMLFSELGQAVAVLIIAAVALLRLMYLHPWPNVRECAAATTVLLTLLMLAAPHIYADLRKSECAQVKVSPIKALPSAPAEPSVQPRRNLAKRSATRI